MCKIPTSVVDAGRTACLTDGNKAEFPGSLYTHECTLLTDTTNCDVFHSLTQCEICMSGYNLDVTDLVCKKYCEKDSYMCKSNETTKIVDRYGCLTTNEKSI